ncbi:hypothetical protein PC110_g10552 [Phytophthora cactorum]|uniref:Uncharacterized protein n=1 Tax=Phytophthora cactorum TaxID=29920 RepID=A0A329S928_9STRA|nr:hypothetical protein PC110_g10552 [Phytophthora cactorum]
MGFKSYICHSNHALGNSKVIHDNQHLINFPKTNNECVFHCVAWHLLGDGKNDPCRIQAQVKEAFQRYCFYKGISYTLGLFRSFKPVDLLQVDEFEECFQLAVNVYSMDVDTGKVECIRRSDSDYDTIHILSHDNHALYIKNIDMLQSKYQCSKCEIFL